MVRYFLATDELYKHQKLCKALKLYKTGLRNILYEEANMLTGL